MTINKMKERGPSRADKHVGARIRMARNMRGMSQEKLGDALGLTFQQVQKYEKGANRISAGRLVEVSRALTTPLPFFYDGVPGGQSTSSESNDLVARFFGTTGAPTMAGYWVRLDTQRRSALLDTVAFMVPPEQKRAKAA